MDAWKTKYLFPAMGMIPIDRSGGNAAERALNTAARVLERGELFGIYPEGTRARDGSLHRGHTGPPASPCARARPIVPVGIVGTREIQPPDAKLPRAVQAVPRSRFGRPIDVEPLRRPSRRPAGAAADHRRGDVRDPRADRARSTSTSTPPRRPRRSRRPRRPTWSSCDDRRRTATGRRRGRRRRRSSADVLAARLTLARSGSRPDASGSGTLGAHGRRDHDQVARRFDACVGPRHHCVGAGARTSAPGWPRRR